MVDFETYMTQEAERLAREAWQTWRAEMLADDPDLTEEQVSEEAYADYLVGMAEQQAEESAWARGCDRGSWGR